jgi:hypothetical protein
MLASTWASAARVARFHAFSPISRRFTSSPGVVAM